MKGLEEEYNEKVIDRFQYNKRQYKIVQIDHPLFKIWVKNDKGDYFSPGDMARTIVMRMKDPSFSKLPPALRRNL